MKRNAKLFPWTPPPGFARRMLSCTILALYSLIVPGVSAAIGSGIAPVTVPAGGFQIDGDLQANTPTSGKGDWVPNGNGGGGSVLDSNGNPLNTTTTYHLVDAYASGTDDNFAGGDKVNQNPQTAWNWTANPVGGKVDINHALIHLFTDANGKQWAIVAGDRMSDSGTAYIDFEFLQNTLTANDDATKSFSSAGPHGGRTVNDFLVTVSITGGGSAAGFLIQQWKDIGGGKYDYVNADVSSLVSNGSIFAAANPAAGTPSPYKVFGNDSYLQNTFVEAAVNLTDLVQVSQNFNPCTDLRIKTILVKTKESDSSSANIVDFIKPVQVKVTIGLAEAGQAQSKCAANGASTPFSLTGLGHPGSSPIKTMTWTSLSPNATLSSPSSCNGCTSLPVTADVTNPAPGQSATATLRLTVEDQAGCVKTDDVILTINPGPSCDITAPVGGVTGGVQNTFTGPAGMDTYAWSYKLNGGGAVAAGSSSSATIPVPLSTASVEVTLTTTKNGCTSTCSQTYFPPAECIVSGVLPTCPGTAQIFSLNTPPPAGSTVEWSISPDPGTAHIVGSNTGNSVEVAASSCATFTITAKITPSVGDPVSCGVGGSFVDTTAPVPPSDPEPLTVQCGDTVPGAVQLKAQDACAGEIIGVPSDSAPVANGCGSRITRTWTFTDSCGNSSTAHQTINIVDTVAPIPPSDPAPLTVQCGDTIPAAIQLKAQDACKGEIIGVPMDGERILNQGGCGYTILRTWTFTDSCGNSSTAHQTINIIDTVAPVPPSDPAPLTVQSGDTIPTAVQLKAQDVCGGEIIGVPSDSEPVADGCGSKITRTWTFTDSCNNSSTAHQTINIVDTLPPVAPADPAPLTVQCGDTVPTAIELKAQDASGSEIIGVPTDGPIVPNQNGCGSTITRTWTFTDSCNNSSTAHQTINIVDTTAPVPPNDPAPLTVECGDTVPTAVQLKAQDACKGEITGVPSDGPRVANQNGCGYTITRTWTFTDSCNNSSTAHQTINIIDTVAPVPPSDPAPITVQCGATVPAAIQLKAQDACGGEITGVPSDGPRVANQNGCGYTITRTWTFTDSCNNSSTAHQTINIIDTTAPVAPSNPAPLNLQCNDPIPTAVQLKAQDACAGEIIGVPSDSQPVANGCGFTITRTWTFTDSCNNSSTAHQTINIVDTTKPVLHGLPASTASYTCYGDFVAAGTPTVTATDNCDSSVQVNFTEQQTAPGKSCNTITRKWTAQDTCGNKAEFTQTITVKDNINPVIVGPVDKFMNCDNCNTDISNTGEPSLISDNCGSYTVSGPTDEVAASGCAKTIKRTWVVTDECGNKASWTQNISCVPPLNVLVTSSSLCTFDIAPSIPGNQFRLIFTQDVPAYRLTASNPGQTFFNRFYIGTPGEKVSFKVTIPYPYVTQGAQPLHAYDWAGISIQNGSICITPGNAFYTGSQQITLGSYPDKKHGDSYSFEVKDLTVPPTGVIYLNMHLDYGLKKTVGYMPNGNLDAVDYSTKAKLIPNLYPYLFSSESGGLTFSDTVQNLNEFKKNPGVAGLVTSGPDQPIVGAKIELKTSTGAIVATGFSDEDGWYLLTYKHTGKATDYTVVASKPGYATRQSTVNLKANGFAQKDFLLTP